MQAARQVISGAVHYRCKNLTNTIKILNKNIKKYLKLKNKWCIISTINNY
ncbi:hypothetical protein BRYFOR_07823 [Marvinbryantia formatexigens DSM 14469]|uniref:Uncharacterized protein n=1 Tax=Marvinbryantia formatexigens DSM 14469 TaxID=478749 RepID=C6LGR3_9FIRM|nr:hypothetical protein BRYFOR_07823 [Marvinbryantia formatexigens DSM 14469]